MISAPPCSRKAFYRRFSISIFESRASAPLLGSMNHFVKISEMKLNTISQYIQTRVDLGSLIHLRAQVILCLLVFSSLLFLPLRLGRKKLDPYIVATSQKIISIKTKPTAISLFSYFFPSREPTSRENKVLNMHAAFSSSFPLGARSFFPFREIASLLLLLQVESAEERRRSDRSNDRSIQTWRMT